MESRMKKIKGYFKIEKLNDKNEIIETYEDFNTVMARVPELYAGQCSGLYLANIEQYSIHAFAIGTGGSKLDSNGDKIPLEVSNDRTQLFSEENYWTQSEDVTKNRTDDATKRVYQKTWSFQAPPPADRGNNPSAWSLLENGDQGSTLPYSSTHVPGTNGYDYVPELYRNNGFIGANEDKMIGKVNLVGNAITYEFILGQFAGNHTANTVEYTEAGLYMKLNANTADVALDPGTGNGLGQLFSMKTFPAQFKNSTCALRVTWKLYF